MTTFSSSYLVHSTRKRYSLAWPLCGHIWCCWCINTTILIVGIKLIHGKTFNIYIYNKLFSLNTFFPLQMIFWHKNLNNKSLAWSNFCLHATISKIQNKNKLAKPIIDLRFSIPYITKSQNFFSNEITHTGKKGPYPSINCTPNTSNKKI